MKTALLGTLVAFCLIVGCDLRSAADEFAQIFGVSLPPEAQMLERVRKGEQGSIFRFRVGREELLRIKRDAVIYTSWHPVKQGLTFEAAGRQLSGMKDVRGEYSLGSSHGGVTCVLILDIDSGIIVGLGATLLM